MTSAAFGKLQTRKASALNQPKGQRSGNALAAFDPEWLIGAGRLVTAIFAVVAVYLDPTQPAHFFRIAQIVLGFYTTFALTLVILPIRHSLSSKVHLLSHGVDVVVLGGLAFLTNELTSPFFAFLPFILLATTMRWGMNGAIVGAVVLEIVLILVGLPDLEDGESELNVMIMRSAYFVVAAGMLGYFGASRDRSRQRLARLADWPSDSVTSDRILWLKSIIQHAAEVLGDPRLLIVWEDQEEPMGSVGYWSEGALKLFDIADEAFWSVQNLEKQPSDGIFGNMAAQIEHVRSLLHSIAELNAGGISPIRRAYSAPFSGLRYRGWLFVLDPACHPEESVLLTNIIAVRIGAELERLALLQQVSITARSEERVRLARDLHDSILQDLTAAGLKLKAATGRVPEEARPELALVSALMLEQQRRIRMFVENAHSFNHRAQTALTLALDNCVKSLGRQWNCEISIAVHPPESDVSARISAEIVQLISEATANAVRHGHATKLDITAVCNLHELILQIDDNGHGITTGRDDPGKKPISLSARVRDLGGVLSIIRHTPGLAMHIRLPIAGGAGA